VSSLRGLSNRQQVTRPPRKRSRGFEGVTIPFVDIFGDRPADVSFSFYRLVPETLTGRKEVVAEL